MSFTGSRPRVLPENPYRGPTLGPRFGPTLYNVCSVAPAAPAAPVAAFAASDIRHHFAASGSGAARAAAGGRGGEAARVPVERAKTLDLATGSAGGACGASDAMEVDPTADAGAAPAALSPASGWLDGVRLERQRGRAAAATSRGAPA